MFLALGVELASDVSSAEVESAGLSVRKVTGPVPSGVGREGGGLEEEEEEEGVRRGGRKKKRQPGMLRAMARRRMRRRSQIRGRTSVDL